VTWPFSSRTRRGRGLLGRRTHVIGSHLSITHTVIEPTYRGRGLSWALVGGALDDIRTKYPTVMNYCPVVSRFVENNPSYGDLLSRPRRV
jgi:predicted GNAT family acetyltransferase